MVHHYVVLARCRIAPGNLSEGKAALYAPMTMVTGGSGIGIAAIYAHLGGGTATIFQRVVEAGKTHLVLLLADEMSTVICCRNEDWTRQGNFCTYGSSKR